jgi:hypothetical protein
MRYTYGDIKLQRASRELLIYKRELIEKIEKCRNLKEYERLEKMVKLIESKF